LTTTYLPLSSEGIQKQVEYLQAEYLPYCEQNEDPNYLAHLNAPNIARDLDLIRNLTGFETSDYYGANYGTVIGITYAGLFPDRVGHMILDGISTNYVLKLTCDRRV
jgi:pimeloyl-ACP methyl ester carboxylesterase